MFKQEGLVCSECGQPVGHLITGEIVADCFRIVLDEDIESGNLPDDQQISRIRQSDALPDDWEFGDQYTWPVFYRCPGCGALGHVVMGLPWILIGDQTAAE
jgi:hypothetical protein